MFTGTSTGASTGVSTGTSTGPHRRLYRDSTRFMGRERGFADVKCETLVRDASQIRVRVHDVEKVSGETMTETMTNGRKNEKRDTTYCRIALRVAPPGLEPGLS